MTEGLSTTSQEQDSEKKKRLLAMAKKLQSVVTSGKPFYVLVKEHMETNRGVKVSDVNDALLIAFLSVNGVEEEDAYRTVAADNSVSKYFDSNGIFSARPKTDVGEVAQVAEVPTLSREGDVSETMDPSFKARVIEQIRRLEVVSPGLPDKHELAVRMVRKQVEKGKGVASETPGLATRVLRSTSVSRRLEAEDALLSKQQDEVRSEIVKLRAEEAQKPSEVMLVGAREALAEDGGEGWSRDFDEYRKKEGDEKERIEQEILKLEKLRDLLEYKDEIDYIRPFFDAYFPSEHFFEAQGGRQTLLDIAVKARRLDPRFPPDLSSLLAALDEAVRHKVEGKPFTSQVYKEYLSQVIIEGGVSEDILLLNLVALQNNDDKDVKQKQLFRDESERVNFLKTVINTAVLMMSEDRDSHPSAIFVRAFNQRIEDVSQYRAKQSLK